MICYQFRLIPEVQFQWLFIMYTFGKGSPGYPCKDVPIRSKGSRKTYPSQTEQIYKYPLKINGWKMTFPFEMVPFLVTCVYFLGCIAMVTIVPQGPWLKPGFWWIWEGWWFVSPFALGKTRHGDGQSTVLEMYFLLLIVIFPLNVTFKQIIKFGYFFWWG